VCYNCKKADVIVGPMGIVLADAMLGELTPAMACAVGESDALRVLIPVSHCHTVVAGVSDRPAARHMDDAVEAVAAFVGRKGEKDEK
jgi:hypothetical protein